MRRSVLEAVMGACLLTACASPSAGVAATPSPHLVATVTQTMSDCSLTTVAKPIKEGNASIQMINKTNVSVAFDVWPLPAGRTYADAVAFIAQERKLAESNQPGLGHPAFFPYDSPFIEGRSLSAGLTVDSTVRGAGLLDAGVYVIVCLRAFAEASGEIRPSGVAGPLTVEAS